MSRGSLALAAALAIAALNVGVSPALAASGSPTIAGAQTVVSGDENVGDIDDPYFRIGLSVGDRMTTDIAFDVNGACLESAYLYDPSVTDFNVNGTPPVRTFDFDCLGDTDFEWTWTSPFTGLGTLSIPAGGTYTFTTTIRHATTTALAPLAPIRTLGSTISLGGKVTSPAGAPVGYCEVYRRHGNSGWVFRRQLRVAALGTCTTTVRPSVRGHWHYEIRFTSNGGDWVSSTSPVRTTWVRG